MKEMIYQIFVRPSDYLGGSLDPDTSKNDSIRYTNKAIKDLVKADYHGRLPWMADKALDARVDTHKAAAIAQKDPAAAELFLKITQMTAKQIVEFCESISVKA